MISSKTFLKATRPAWGVYTECDRRLYLAAIFPRTPAGKKAAEEYAAKSVAATIRTVVRATREDAAIMADLRAACGCHAGCVVCRNGGANIT